MERLHRTVVQLEEAKRFILEGDVAHLRLALILLDNAIEVMMHRVIENELQRASWYGRMLENFLPGPLDAEEEELRREIASHVVPASRQKQIRRYFGEKVKFLSEDRDRIPQASARALVHLHEYRNETQHQDHVRPESVRPAVLVLFDIATDLLVRLEPGMTEWASDEDHTWLERYGFAERFGPCADVLRGRISAQLRSGLRLDTTGVRDALVAHLTDRLEAMDNELGFVAENSLVGPDRALTLKAIQFWNADSSRRAINQGPELEAFVPPHDLCSLTRWREAVEGLSTIDDKLDMFDCFATIEDEFEPLEKMIDDTVSAIDNAIQSEIDRIRGK